MKTITLVRTSALLALAAGAAFAGPLDPPAGPVAPTGKTLAEVEPRIAINSINTPGDSSWMHRITQPGSYYLTGNLVVSPNKSGIFIDAENVTIDLNGFEISYSGPDSDSSGIEASDDEIPERGCTVKNGAIRGFHGSGVSLDDSSTVENVRVRGNGSSSYGILVSSHGRVSGCSVTGANIGIAASYAAIVENCTSAENSQSGYSVVGAVVRGCTAMNNASYGIYAQAGAVVEGNRLYNNGVASGSAIAIAGEGSVVRDNDIRGGWVGVRLNTGAADNLVAANRIRGTGSWPIVMSGQAQNTFPNNHVAQIITNPASPFTATNPFANIEY